MEDRVAIFIDGSNLYHALRGNFGRFDLNFAVRPWLYISGVTITDGTISKSLAGPMRILW